MSKITRRRSADIASIMQFLWSNRGPLDTADLEWLSNASQSAAHWASHLSDSIDAIGCLIANDGSIEDIQAGNFQSADDVPGLLFTISNQIASIGQLCQIGFDAAFELRRREMPHDQI